MKKTKAWAVVYRTGEAWFLELKYQDAKDRLNEYHVDGNIKIVPVLITEVKKR